MKRTTEKKIRWKKTGGGSFRMGNRIIKPGEKFSARPSEIPEAFRNVVIPVDELPEEPTENIVSTPAQYTVQKREGSTWYDVVDGQGKVLNEKALRRTEALKLIESL